MKKTKATKSILLSAREKKSSHLLSDIMQFDLLRTN